MKLERVDIVGFKSFGEKAELTFHKGVTAIVGPNGCGKSNISDAIGWVLGEQSAKSLRGQKMEDLIFGGSESRPALSLAEVNLRVSEVNLVGPADADESEPTDPGMDKKPRARKTVKGEVVVTRRLHRSGDSEYLLDGAPSRLRDIQELFMGTGVGSKAYAIIEQGKIGLILSSKPTDRRILIEEAAGITKYKSRRRSAELKLTAAQQNLLRVNDIVYEITRQMNSLKRQAGKARRYRRLREGMDRLDKIVAVKRMRQLETNLELARSRLGAVSDEELRRASSLTTAENYQEQARLTLAEQDVALTDSRESLHHLELTIERLDQSIERDKQQLVELDQRRETLEKESQDLEKRRGPVLAQLELRKRDEGRVGDELSALESEAGKQQERVKAATVGLAELEAQMEERRSEIVHRVSKIAALHNFLQGVVANSEKVSAELLKLAEERRETQAEEARLREAKTELDSKVAARGEQMRSLQKERETLDEAVSAARAELVSIEERLAVDREELSTLAARLGSLEELVSARAHFATGARLLLTRAREEGVRVLGSVADAIEVEERFERAAEMFFDSALQRIRVATEQDALSVRDFLAAQQEAGRSELLIDSLRGHDDSALRRDLQKLQSAGLSGLLGLLSDGFRWTAEALPGALPDAILVDNLEHAMEAYGRAQLCYVTLAGEVLEPPGVVRVGPGGVSEGLLKTEREIRELREVVAARRDALSTAESARDDVQHRLEEQTKRLESVRDQQHGLEKVLVGLDHEIRQHAEERERCLRKAEVLASEQARFESEKSSLGAKRGEMAGTLESEEERKRMAEEALAAMRSQLVDRREDVEKLQGKAAEEVSRVAALRERRDAVRLDVERLSEGARELELRIASNGREREGLVERKKSLADAVVRSEQELTQSLSSREEKRLLARQLEEEVVRRRASIEVTEGALKNRRRELEDVREQRSGEEVNLAKEESELTHVQQSFVSAHGISISQAASIVNPVDLLRDDEETQSELADLKKKLDAIGPVNPMADEEFRELETRHEFVTKQRQDLLDSIESTETAISRIDRTSRQRFKEAFDAINQEFEVTFRQLFGGGRAGLRLLDEQDVLESGIDIIAQPPGKTLQNVLLLSGGEKAMTAIALLFAIFRYRPSPFCLLDEVDAPLDDANVGRFISMLLELRDTTQFIVITHNRKTMEMADQLYGVTMAEPGVSKLVSVNLVGEAEERRQALTSA